MKRKLDPNKIYAFIGRAVVYSSLYVGTVVFGIWAFCDKIQFIRMKEMYSFIFTIIIWLLIIPVLLIDNLVIVKILVAIQIILLIAQIIYVFLEFKN